MPIIKKIYSGIFRDGDAGKSAKRRYRERRKKLLQREDQLMAITGVPYGPGGETVWSYAFCPTYQEPAIMYLTGINQSNVILLLDPRSKESNEILFVGKKDLKTEFWDGVRFGVGDKKTLREVQKVTGIQDVRYIEVFPQVLNKRFLKQKKKQMGVLWMEGMKNGRRKSIQTDHNWAFRKKISGWMKSWKVPKAELVNIMKGHFDLRLPLDKYDIANSFIAI